MSGGAVPVLAHNWQWIRLKHLCTQSALYGANEAAESYVNEGIRFLRTTDITEGGDLRSEGAVFLPANLVDQYVLSDGDLLLSRSGTIGRSFVYDARTHGPCAYAGYLVRFVPGPRLQPRFAFYATKSTYFTNWVVSQVVSSTIGNVNGQKFANLPIPLPDSDQQREIVEFLDRKTSVIDDLITAKKQLIDCAMQRRISFVAKACVHGLDSTVNRSTSGIPIIGDVPSHWRICRNKVLFKEVDERSHDGSEELLTVSHITGVTRRSDKPDVTMFMAESLQGYKKCAADDLIINTMWAWMGALGISKYDGIVSPGYNVYRLKGGRMLPGYVDLLYRTPQYVAEFTRWSKGVWESRLRLYPFEFFQILTPVPPLEEQQKIVDAVKEKTGGIEAAVQTLQKSITLLSEYRAALISAAITGQIDVRNYRAQEAAAACQ